MTVNKEEMRKTLDDLIYSWSKVNELHKKGYFESLDSYYPFEDNTEEMLHKLINWRASLDE